MNDLKLKNLMKYRYNKYRELVSKIKIDNSEIISNIINIESEILNQALFISFSKLFNIYLFENELTFINHLISKKLLNDTKLNILINNYKKYKRIYNSSEWIEKLYS